MKNLLYTTVLLIGLFCSAQEQVLVNNDWYLEKLVINGADYPLPEDQDEVDFIILNFINSEEFSTQEIVTSVCNVFFGPIEYNENFSFELLGLSSGLAHCIEQVNVNYENLYADFYSLSDMPVTANYSYDVVENGTSLKLTIVNENQDIAIYNSTILSTIHLNQVSISTQIYPNPVANKLRIKSQQPIHQVEVFSLNGKRVLNAAYQENQAMDVSSLPSGLYILKIETENGSVTKKLVKE